VAFGRCRKRRGGTPEGERAAFSARRARMVRPLKQMRLPAFRFLFLSSVPSYFVIAGLDPAIHAAKRLEQNSGWLTSPRVSMDRRGVGERSDAVLRTAMPGGDEELFDIVDRETRT
jgi:hypothetical protein